MSLVSPTSARLSRPLLTLLQGLFTLALTLVGLLLITFALSALSPVDRVLQIVGDHASQATYDQVRHQLGLDRPLPVQFWHYLTQLAPRRFRHRQRYRTARTAGFTCCVSRHA